MTIFKTLTEAQAEQELYGGILLVLDDGTYGICLWCKIGVRMPDCNCNRADEWINSLAPSWSEAAPENLRRDPRNKNAAEKGLKIAQVGLF